jgi:hypothetical protein
VEKGSDHDSYIAEWRHRLGNAAGMIDVEPAELRAEPAE